MTAPRQYAPSEAAHPAEEAIWHDVECGAYRADLPVWEELAARARGPVLELGCGAGRVALHLARRGHEVVGVDLRGALLEALVERAGEERLPVRAERGDVRDLALGRRFALAIAPMQLAHLLGSRAERLRMLAGVERHLEPGAAAAFALLDPESAAESAETDDLAALPDVRERDGWVFSSLPLSLRLDESGVEVRRRRQAVSPEGKLSEQVDTVYLAALSPQQLEAEAAEAGLRAAGRRKLAPTDAHTGSVVVLLRAGEESR